MYIQSIFTRLFFLVKILRTKQIAAIFKISPLPQGPYNTLVETRAEHKPDDTISILALQIEYLLRKTLNHSLTLYLQVTNIFIYEKRKIEQRNIFRGRIKSFPL